MFKEWTKRLSLCTASEWWKIKKYLTPLAYKDVKEDIKSSELCAQSIDTSFGSVPTLSSSFDSSSGLSMVDNLMESIEAPADEFEVRSNLVMVRFFPKWCFAASWMIFKVDESRGCKITPMSLDIFCTCHSGKEDVLIIQFEQLFNILSYKKRNWNEWVGSIVFCIFRGY